MPTQRQMVEKVLPPSLRASLTAACATQCEMNPNLPPSLKIMTSQVVLADKAVGNVHCFQLLQSSF